MTIIRVWVSGDGQAVVPEAFADRTAHVWNGVGDKLAETLRTCGMAAVRGHCGSDATGSGWLERQAICDIDINGTNPKAAALVLAGMFPDVVEVADITEGAWPAASVELYSRPADTCVGQPCGSCWTRANVKRVFPRGVMYFDEHFYCAECAEDVDQLWDAEVVKFLREEEALRG